MTLPSQSVKTQLPQEPSNSTGGKSSIGLGSGGSGGKGRCGESHRAAKLSAQQVWEIRDIYVANTQGECNRVEMQEWLAQKFNITLGTIKKIVHWTTWRKPWAGLSWEDWSRAKGLHGGRRP
jgi:hypothetical protein